METRPMVNNDVPIYDFKIGNIISEAWEKTTGLKGSYWAAFFLIFLVSIVAYFIAGYVSALFEGSFAAEENRGAIRPILMGLGLLINIFIVTPLFAGLLMLAIKRCKELPINFKMAFQYYQYVTRLWVLPIIFFILQLIGVFLAGIPLVQLIVTLACLYITITYVMYTPLIVDKKLAIVSALEGSRKAIFQHWFKVFGLFIVMGLIIIVSAIPIGIGLIWTLPMANNVIAILYRTIFGIEGNE